MNITDETILYVSALAKLDLKEEEKISVKKDLESILGYIEIMNELNTEDVEPISHIFPVKNVFREDEIRNTENRDSLLENAPSKKDGYFQVPKTVE